MVIVPAWLAAMSWLVAHDIAPGWTATDAPPVRRSPSLAGGKNEAQFEIYDEFGRVGTLWTRYTADERSLQRDDLIWLDRLPLDLAPLRVTAGSAFTADGVLDEFTIRLETLSTDVKLHGERFPADFSFRLQTGTIDKTFKVPLTKGGLISGAFHPFADMSDLQVGTRWRMQVVSPVALLTGVGKQFIPVLVEVTGEERIATPGGDRNCLIVESPNAKAWIDAEGLVVVQEVDLPALGRFRIVRQSGYDEKERNRVRQVPLGAKKKARR
jgi:hypothetical protein